MRQQSPDEDALVGESAGKLLILVSPLVAILLFVSIHPRLGISFGNIFQTMLDFFTTCPNAAAFLVAHNGANFASIISSVRFRYLLP